MIGWSTPVVPEVSRFLPNQYVIANLPNPAHFATKYAWVTDLHDGQPDNVISDGVSWKPVRPLATRHVPNANQNMGLQALVNSPTQIMRGTLTANRQMTLSKALAYSGARFRIKREAGGLFAISVLGLVTASINLSMGSWADFEYSVADGGWVQTASGGLL